MYFGVIRTTTKAILAWSDYYFVKSGLLRNVFDNKSIRVKKATKLY